MTYTDRAHASSSRSRSRSRVLRPISGAINGVRLPSKPPNYDVEAAAPRSKNTIELTGKVLGDGGDYNASVSGGADGALSVSSSDHRPADGAGSRMGSQDPIVAGGGQREGIVMVREVKVTDRQP